MDLLIEKTREDLSALAEDLKSANVNTDRHEELLKSFLANNRDLEAIWTNNQDGSFISSVPPAGIANALNRPWFREASEGHIYVSEIYISSISQQPCITISMPVLDDHDNQIFILGADLRLVSK